MNMDGYGSHMTKYLNKINVKTVDYVDIKAEQHFL